MKNKLLKNYNELVPKRYQTVTEVYDFLANTFPTYSNQLRISFGSGALYNWILVHYKNTLIGRISGTCGLQLKDKNEMHNDMCNLVN